MTRVAAIALFALLGGCALLPPSGDGVIGEALSAARAPAAEQKAALSRAQELFVRSQDPIDRLRLGTLLVVLPPPLRDDARAMELLQPIADASSPGVGRLAALVSSQVAEHQRLVREAERAARDSERQAKERERVDRERERVDKERDKREEALRQQLEALRSIERGILEREDRLRRKQR